MNPSRKPQVIRRGNVSVKLYTVNNRSGGSTYRQFVLAYRNAEGKRETRKFSDAEQARTDRNWPQQSWPRAKRTC